MKKLVILLSVTIALFVISCAGPAENKAPEMPGPGAPEMPQPAPQDPKGQPAPISREEQMEQIKMQKIAYMTDELKLTVDESQNFWPIYNQWWEENMELIHDQYSTMKKINKSEDASLEDLETIALFYEKQANLVRKWGAEFAKVLPENKVAKVFVTEERFKNYLIRKGPKWGGQPQK